MTLNDLEYPIQLKVRFTGGTLDVDVRVLWISGLAMHYRMNMGLNCQRQKCDFRALWGLYEFSPGFTAEGRRTGVELVNLWFLFTLCNIISQISWDVWPFLICIITKALSSFLMILRQMTFKVRSVWKLHRPRMLHGSLADNVDTSFARLLQLYNKCGVQWSALSLSEPKRTCVTDALSLCGSWASCLNTVTKWPNAFG